jgi:hypothetical protein
VEETIEGKLSQSMSQQNPGQLNIDNLANQLGVSASNLQFSLKTPETAEERQHRLKQAEKDANLRRTKEYATVGIATVSIIGIGIVCLNFIINEPSIIINTVTTPQGVTDTPVPNPKFQWATQVLISLITGLVGWMAGKTQSDKASESK